MYVVKISATVEKRNNLRWSALISGILPGDIQHYRAMIGPLYSGQVKTLVDIVYQCIGNAEIVDPPAQVLFPGAFVKTPERVVAAGFFK